MPFYKGNYYSCDFIVLSEDYCWINLPNSLNSGWLDQQTPLQSGWFNMTSLSFSLDYSAWPETNSVNLFQSSDSLFLASTASDVLYWPAWTQEQTQVPWSALIIVNLNWLHRTQLNCLHAFPVFFLSRLSFLSVFLRAGYFLSLTHSCHIFLWFITLFAP